MPSNLSWFYIELFCSINILRFIINIVNINTTSTIIIITSTFIFTIIIGIIVISSY